LFVSPDAQGLEVNTIDPPPARPHLEGVRAQAITMIAVAALSLVAGGLPAVRSALFGAGIAWVTTYYASSRARVAEHSVGAALQRVLVGEFIKVIGTIALFAVATRLPHTVWPALLCGYVAALVVSWLPSMSGTAGGQVTRGMG
jgi:F0F1-type ATP synthase assembly protein I